ncbi:MAG: hypothetical protein DCC69_14435 [Hyphomicrobiales bacterium]|nr:MAG: hypothetical protein DCC69_14435 [Hyphomicrobiales bacterium]
MSSDRRNSDRGRRGKPRATAGAREKKTARHDLNASGASTSSAVPQERRWGQARREGQRRRRQREEQRWSIVSDLVHPLPVTFAELDVIENHLGALLDELLGFRMST